MSVFLAYPSFAVAKSSEVQYHEIEKLERQAQILDARLDSEREARDRQADAFDAAASRIEAVNFAATVVVALVGLIVALFGIKALRNYVEDLVEESTNELTSEMVEKRAEELIEKWDGRFATEYRRFEGLTEELEKRE